MTSTQPTEATLALVATDRYGRKFYDLFTTWEDAAMTGEILKGRGWLQAVVTSEAVALAAGAKPLAAILD